MNRTLKTFGRPAALILGALAFAALTVNALTSGQGPNPVSDVGAWTDWASRDPVNALIMLVSALLAGFGAWGTVSNLINPNASRQDLTEAAEATRDTIRAADDASAGRDAEMTEHLRRLEAKIEAMARTAGAGPREQPAAGVAEALASVAASTTLDMAPAREAIRREDPRAVIAALMATEGPDRARRLKEAGALATDIATDTAIAAYEEAVRLEPDFDSLLALALLKARSGDGTPEARRALDLATSDLQRLSASSALALLLMSDDRPEAKRILNEAAKVATRVRCAGSADDLTLHELRQLEMQRGNLAFEDGDYAAARRHFETVLSDLTAMAAERPDVAWIQRGVATVHERLASVARQTNNLPATRGALENALATYNDLLERDGEASATLAGLAEVHHALADLSILEKAEPSVALAGYRRAAALRERLYADDPSNARALADLIVSRRREIAALMKIDDMDRALAATGPLRRLADAATISNETALYNAAAILSVVGQACVRRGRVADALAPLRSALEVFERLIEAAPRGERFLSDVFAPSSALIDGLRQTGDLVGAIAIADRALAHCRRLLSGEPDNLEGLLASGQLNGVKGEAQQSAADWAGAAASFEAARVGFLAHAAAAGGEDAAESRRMADVCGAEAEAARAGRRA